MPLFLLTLGLFVRRAIDIRRATVLQHVEPLWDEVRAAQDDQDLRDEDERHQQFDPIVRNNVITHYVTVWTFMTACVDEVGIPEVTMKKGQHILDIRSVCADQSPGGDHATGQH